MRPLRCGSSIDKFWDQHCTLSIQTTKRGIELLAIEARVVIASVETYLKYAEAVGLTQSAAVPA